MEKFLVAERRLKEVKEETNLAMNSQQSGPSLRRLDNDSPPQPALMVFESIVTRVGAACVLPRVETPPLRGRHAGLPLR